MKNLKAFLLGSPIEGIDPFVLTLARILFGCYVVLGLLFIFYK